MHTSAPHSFYSSTSSYGAPAYQSPQFGGFQPRFGGQFDAPQPHFSHPAPAPQQYGPGFGSSYTQRQPIIGSDLPPIRLSLGAAYQSSLPTYHQQQQFNGPSLSASYSEFSPRFSTSTYVTAPASPVFHRHHQEFAPRFALEPRPAYSETFSAGYPRIGASFEANYAPRYDSLIPRVASPRFGGERFWDRPVSPNFRDFGRRNFDNFGGEDLPPFRRDAASDRYVDELIAKFKRNLDLPQIEAPISPRQKETFFEPVQLSAKSREENARFIDGLDDRFFAKTLEAVPRKIEASSESVAAAPISGKVVRVVSESEPEFIKGKVLTSAPVSRKTQKESDGGEGAWA